MALVHPNLLLDSARHGGYAVGYFESWNLESLQGVVDAAEATRSPVFLGFNGEFLTHADRTAPEQIPWYASLALAAAESATVPCAVIFNECAQDDAVRLAIDAGFNLVMPDDPAASYDDSVRRIAELTRYAHEHGVAVEAGMGDLPCGASGSVEETGSSMTDPDMAAAFVEQTGIDLLAISVGNVHILLDGARGLDLDRLSEIASRVGVPLDLHGGTGISSDALKDAISIGVAKVCYGTYIKQNYLATMRAALNSEQPDPHRLLGMGGDEDILVACRKSVCDSVLERIESLGCCGKA